MPSECSHHQHDNDGTCALCRYRSLEAEPILMAVTELLELRSSESTLICRSGHVAGHPHLCARGCELLDGHRTVRDVLGFKELRVVPLYLPVGIEGGWLIDGHHRVRRALAENITFLPVRFVRGVLQEQRAYHQQIAREASLPASMRSTH